VTSVHPLFAPQFSRQITREIICDKGLIGKMFEIHGSFAGESTNVIEPKSLCLLMGAVSVYSFRLSISALHLFGVWDAPATPFKPTFIAPPVQASAFM
jgi:hypothetical protein